MKKIVLLIIVSCSFSFNAIKAQDSCLTAFPICTGTGYDFDAPTGFPAEPGPDYGCVGSAANPLWLSIEVGTPGGITITGSGLDFGTVPAPIDIDYVYWGPFTSLAGICYDELTAATILGCDYSGSNLINIALPTAAPGDFYICVITNYANATGNIHFEQTAGSGSTACGSGCSFASMSAIPTSCDSADNSYSVSGSVVFYNSPATGTLTIFGSCGGSQTFTAPFVSPLTYTLSGLPSNGSSCFVSAAFSTDSCSINKMYTAPPVCNSNAIEEYAIKDFSVFPNPSSGMFELVFESPASQMNLFITDILGRVVYQEAFLKPTGSIQKKIDISEVKKGLYFVQLQSEAGTILEKMIVQ